MSKVKTGLSASDNKAKEILESVIGQLSDGIWENSPGMIKYWKTLDVTTDGGDIVIVSSDGWDSPFHKYGESERGKKILDFFANKVKQIIKIEIEDGYTRDSKKMEWKRDCDAVSEYMGYNEEITVKDCYRVYDKLKGRKDRISESKKKLVEGSGNMTANQWVNAISKASRCPKDVIELLFGKDLAEIEEFIIGAESEKEFEDTLETFANDIDIRIQQLKRLSDHLYEVPYDKI